MQSNIVFDPTGTHSPQPTPNVLTHTETEIILFETPHPLVQYQLVIALLMAWHTCPSYTLTLYFLRTPNRIAWTFPDH